MTTKGEIARVRRQFFPFEIHNGKRCTEAGGASVHLFSSERSSPAGGVRARLPAKSMNSVFERESQT